VAGYIDAALQSPAWKYILDLVFSFCLVTLLFAAIFKFMPDADVAWRQVWIGAVLTAALFTAGKFLIGFYLGHSSSASSYGAASSLLVLLLWVYYSALIFLFGAEFTQVEARFAGQDITPDEHGEPAPPQPKE
jgi:membrane protein